MQWYDPNNFPTPIELGMELASLIPIYEEDDVVEPSAGFGDLMEAILKVYPFANLRAVEVQAGCVDVLKRKGFHGWQGDFLKFREPADVFIANPPFRSDFQDIDHFVHAWNLLRPGGRMAFILHEYSAFPKYGFGKPARFVKFLREIGAEKKMNPPGSFSNGKRPTNTGTAMVWVQKPVAIPLSSLSHSLSIR